MLRAGMPTHIHLAPRGSGSEVGRRATALGRGVADAWHQIPTSSGSTVRVCTASGAPQNRHAWARPARSTAATSSIRCPGMSIVSGSVPMVAAVTAP